MKLKTLGLLVTALFLPGVTRAGLQEELTAWRGDGPGGIAAVVVSHEGTTFVQAGSFAADDARPITADTQFEIGSVTKVFTALLLAESERQGRVKREEPVASFLWPQGDVAGLGLKAITFEALATHTSGLPRLPVNMKTAAAPDPYADYGGAALIADLKLEGPRAAVGGGLVYSNMGFALLGEALGAAWGQGYADALETHVLRPLGLEHTTLAMTGGAAPADFAPGHSSGGKRVEHWHFQACAPAGALRSSTRELALFLQALLGLRETPLREALAETSKPLKPAPQYDGWIGLGWLISGEGDQRVVWHNGATGGFFSFVGFRPATGRGVALLGNAGRPVDALGFALLGVPMPKAKLQPVEKAADFTGSYSFTPEVSLVVTSDHGGLFIQLTAQPRLALRPTKTADRFAVLDAPAEVSFEREITGRVDAVILYQNGLDQRAPRTPEIALDGKQIAACAGDYTLSPKIKITVTAEGDRLFVQLTGQPRFELFAAAPDRFFLKVVNAQMVFERDAGGLVTALTLIQNGEMQRAPRQ